jgi:hypothetical protein
MAKVCVNATLGSYHNSSTMGRCERPATLVLPLTESRIFLTGILERKRDKEISRYFPLKSTAKAS